MIVPTLIILQILDWLTTLILVTQTSPSVEGNPIMRFLLELPGGVVWFTLIKVIFCLLIWWIVPRTINDKYGYVWYLLVAIYIGTVLNNLIGIGLLLMH